MASNNGKETSGRMSTGHFPDNGASSSSSSGKDEKAKSLESNSATRKRKRPSEEEKEKNDEAIRSLIKDRNLGDIVKIVSETSIYTGDEKDGKLINARKIGVVKSTSRYKMISKRYDYPSIEDLISANSEFGPVKRQKTDGPDKDKESSSSSKTNTSDATAPAFGLSDAASTLQTIAGQGK